MTAFNVNYSKVISQTLKEVFFLSLYQLNRNERKDTVLDALTYMRDEALTMKNQDIKVSQTDPKWYQKYKERVMKETEEMIKNGEKNKAKEIRRVISGILDKEIASQTKKLKSYELFIRPENNKGGLKLEKTYPVSINQYITEKGSVDYLKFLNDLITTCDGTSCIKQVYSTALIYFKQNNPDIPITSYEFATKFLNELMEDLRKMDDEIFTEEEQKLARRIVSQEFQPKVKKIQQQHQYNKAKAVRIAKRNAKKEAKKNK